ncbi:NAD(+) synthase [Nakamurella multipartita]|jgi:NAD+ synthase (glutamine-hydrolysing)|uniref:Glutamine-dependent NAD(+) synthetase n=1 Tax=Nakamurella multipartita (strain ATCC 700099 / DSM 44233 / CIP 104796 / JCM 9543 / NBRC 105858 / Y-104) TaxID=479431 RepID=C8X733_NAKMY|nr:NAD(+) synthase [Nakamurella multipartita]ACV76902.1 NAD+ synthetase [Nakamurella multipartita DSM 44233]
MTFRSLYAHGFARVAACTADVWIADPTRNAAGIAAVARQCSEQGVAVALFPELSLTGYAIDDLLGQQALLDAVHAAIGELCTATADLLPVIIVGAPLRHRDRLFNCAVVLHRGSVLGVVPKIHLPNYREFYERRQFASGDGIVGQSIPVAGQDAPFGTDLLFPAADLPGLTIGVEICEDMFVPVPPSSGLALAGATVLLNLSGSPITIGRADTRAALCRAQSMRCLSAYLYAAAGRGESTTDLSWDGQTSIFENGVLLAKGPRFAEDPVVTVADVDLDRLRQERARQGTFDDNRRAVGGPVPRTVEFTLQPPDADLGLRRVVERFPFVPADPERLAQDCYEAYNIQVDGLVQRLRAIGTRTVVIGVSGGLDSTHALIVAARAMDLLGYPRTNIRGFTMPGFATGTSTKANAWALMRALGITANELDIRPAARQMLADLDHPFGRGEEVYDITFENVQAGLRTDYLFRLANHHHGIVLGTGDLSELALGWSTYGVGDQMSHYNVNAGVPKTLIQHLIRWVAGLADFSDDVDEILLSILGTEISPELIPVKDGEVPQSTEKSIGPYELQDFNLFYTLRYGFPPSKIAFLAWHAWHDVDGGLWPIGFPPERRRAYDLAPIRQWLTVFVKRYFGFSQFKRSAMPNGPKVSAGGSLSPRGDWRAPSDGNAAVWLAELERNVPTE